MNTTDSEKKRLYLDIIVQLRDSSSAWVTRKEIAAWTAAAFYVDGLVTISGFVFKESENVLQISVLSIAVLCELCLFLIFIHSQYSQIYDSTALISATNRCSFLFANTENLDDFYFRVGE